MAAQNTYQALIDAAAEGVIGAGLCERSEDRTAARNRSRPQLLSITGRDLHLRISRLRTGSLFSILLKGCRRISQALFAVVMEVYLDWFPPERSTTW